jgi:hypothetical protein
MLKATLTSALLVSASATDAQDAVKAGSAAVKRAKDAFHQIQTSQKTHALKAVNNYKLANKVVSLQARGVTGAAKKSRALRGKSGKGKGKSKSDDDKDDEGDEVDIASRKYLQMSSGFCSGTDIGTGPYTEDFYVFHGQFANNVCLNSVDSDGYAYSSKVFLTGDEFMLMADSYMMHDCQDEYLVATEDITSEFTFGGAVMPNGMCTDFDGFGVKMLVSETPLTMPAGFVASAENSRANDCAMMTDLSTYDELELETSFISIPSFGDFPLCNQEDSDDDGASGSYQYDVSACGDEPSTLTIQHFSDLDCTVPTGSSMEEAKMCALDVQHFVDEIADEGGADFIFSSLFCSPMA